MRNAVAALLITLMTFICGYSQVTNLPIRADSINFTDTNETVTQGSKQDSTWTFPDLVIGTDGSVLARGWVEADTLHLVDVNGITYNAYKVGVTINPPGAGSGDVLGPSSSTDNAVARFNGTTGKAIQNSVVTIDDVGRINANVMTINTTNGIKALTISAGSVETDITVGVLTPSGIYSGSQGDIYIEKTGSTSRWWMNNSLVEGTSGWSPAVFGPGSSTADGIATWNGSDGFRVKSTGATINATNGDAIFQGKVQGNADDNDSGGLVFYQGTDAVTQIFKAGTAAPEGVVTGTGGDVYFQKTGTTSKLWLKRSSVASTGQWVELTSGGVAGQGVSVDQALAWWEGTAGDELNYAAGLKYRTGGGIESQPTSNAAFYAEMVTSAISGTPGIDIFMSDENDPAFRILTNTGGATKFFVGGADPYARFSGTAGEIFLEENLTNTNLHIHQGSVPGTLGWKQIGYVNDVQVNGTGFIGNGLIDLKLTDTVPAAPVGGTNVKWQLDAVGGQVSAYIEDAVVVTNDSLRVDGLIVTEGTTVGDFTHDFQGGRGFVFQPTGSITNLSGLGAIRWVADDPNFTTTPGKKLVAAISSSAREDYTADNDGAADLRFYVSPPNVGAGYNNLFRAFYVDHNQFILDGDYVGGSTNGMQLKMGASGQLVLRPTATSKIIGDPAGAAATPLEIHNNGTTRLTFSSTGGATFAFDASVPAEAYGVGWNGSNEVPTKNDVYDKIETISGGGTADSVWVYATADTMKVNDELVMGHDGGTAFDTLYHATSRILSGTSEEQQDIFITTSTGNIYFEMESTTAGDIEYIHNEQAFDLNCTTGPGTGGRAQVQLTEGTSTVPQINYIYVTFSYSGYTATLNASTSFPTGEFAWVGVAHVLDDATTATDGPLLFQRTTEALKHAGRGQLSYMREKLRWLGAEYLSGIGQTLTITSVSDPDDVVLTLATGTVYQLHRQTWPAYDISTDGLWVANASGSGLLSNYDKVTDINEILETADGTALANNNRYILTIWGAMNSANEAKLFVNLPLATYNSDLDATLDVANTAVTTIPAEFKTTGFLVCQVILKYNTGSSGTFTNVLGGTNTVSLLGLRPGYNLGGSTTSSSSSFSDGTFEIINETDPTKVLNFDVSSLTTATTRTYTWPDKNGTVAMTSDIVGSSLTQNKFYVGDASNNPVATTDLNYNDSGDDLYIASDGASIGIGRQAVSQLDIYNATTAILVNIEQLADGSIGPRIRFNHDSPTPVSGDIIGELEFYGDNSLGASQEYVSIQSKISTAASGSEDASLEVDMQLGSVIRNFIDLEGNYTGTGEGGVIINADKQDISFVVETGSPATWVIDGLSGAMSVTNTNSVTMQEITTAGDIVANFTSSDIAGYIQVNDSGDAGYLGVHGSYIVLGEATSNASAENLRIRTDTNRMAYGTTTAPDSTFDLGGGMSLTGGINVGQTITADSIDQKVNHMFFNPDGNGTNPSYFFNTREVQIGLWYNNPAGAGIIRASTNEDVGNANVVAYGWGSDHDGEGLIEWNVWAGHAASQQELAFIVGGNDAVPDSTAFANNWDVLFGAAGKVSIKGDLVLQNTQSIRSLDFAGTTERAMLAMSSADQTLLTGGTSGMRMRDDDGTVNCNIDAEGDWNIGSSATTTYKLNVVGTFNATGAGSFGGDVTIPADVYGAGWNAAQEAAPKDAVYDKIEGYAAETKTFTNKTLDADENSFIDIPVAIGLAVSDESTDLTTGTAKITFRAPYAFNLTDVRANVNTAPTGATITVDINVNGSTRLSTKLTIDASEKTSETAATPPVISTASVSDDDEFTIDIDQIGSTVAGKGLKIWLIGKRSF